MILVNQESRRKVTEVVDWIDWRSLLPKQDLPALIGLALLCFFNWVINSYGESLSFLLGPAVIIACAILTIGPAWMLGEIFPALKGRED